MTNQEIIEFTNKLLRHIKACSDPFSDYSIEHSKEKFTLSEVMIMRAAYVPVEVVPRGWKVRVYSDENGVTIGEIYPEIKCDPEVIAKNYPDFKPNKK